MIGLFESNIFNHVLDYAEWPENHYNTTKMIAPYNGSSLKLRFKYGEIFKSLFEHDEMHKMERENHASNNHRHGGFLRQGTQGLRNILH